MSMPYGNNNNNITLLFCLWGKEISMYILFYEITNAYFHLSQVSVDIQLSHNNNDGGRGWISRSVVIMSVYMYAVTTRRHIVPVEPGDCV